MTSSPGLVRDQVVDVRVPQPGSDRTEVGSGYLISPTLVLTARHVVGKVRSAEVVFTVRQPAQPLAVPTDVAWTGISEVADIALLRVRWAGGAPPWEVTTAALGDVPSFGWELPFEAIGFPRRKIRALSELRELRDGDRVTGLILGDRNVRTGQLDLHLTEDPAGADKAWAGFSGAAVFARGLLVGVAVKAESQTPDFTAHRIAIPAGTFTSLAGSYAEPEESIARFRELLAEDGHDLRINPARRRPAYAKTIEKKVEDLRPSGGLQGREAELAELRAFASPGGDQAGRPYAEWVAQAWAGKTVLAAHFASDPPPDADIVTFFVSRTDPGQVPEFWTDVCDQLAALVNRPAPLHPGETAFIDLWAEAGEAAKRGDRTLVLLIDGLDEDDQFPLIARAVPRDGDQTRRIIVFRRDEPELRLPAGHPLGDQRQCIRKALVASQPGWARKEEAENTLRGFLAGRQADVLGVLAAAGPISAKDIAMVLCAENPSLPDSRLLSSQEIRPALRRAESAGLVAPVASDPEKFAFQHDTLREITEEQLAADDVIAVHQDAINRLAAQYAELSWPDNTPSYLLTGYPAFLAKLGDTARLAALPTPARITRLRASTGDDATAVGELGLAISQLAKAERADLSAACRLAFRREQLLDALTRYPVSLIEAHAALSHWQRAEQIADYQAWPAARVAGLTAVGVAAASAGQTQRADLLFANALRTLTGIADWTQCSAQRQSLARAAAASGRLVDPRIVSKQFPSLQDSAIALLDFASAYATAGLVDYAEQFMTEATGPAGPQARAAAKAASPPRADDNAGYGLPGHSFTDLADRQAAIQAHLNIISLIAGTAELVIRAAARRMRLDTAIRIATPSAGNYTLLPLVGDAFRTAGISGPPELVSESLETAYATAKGLADPFQRAVVLRVIAATATGQLAGDAAISARQATAELSDFQQTQMAGIVIAATADRPVEGLIGSAYQTAMSVTDTALRAATLTAIAQAAATARLPATDLITDARAAAASIQDPARHALALSTLAQATAVAAQYDAVQRIAAGTIDAALFAKAARLTAAVQLTGSESILGSATGTFNPADLQTSGVQASAAGQIAMIRSIVAGLADPAERARASGMLAQAADSEPAASLVIEARETAAGIPDPQQRAWILGTMAQDATAAGQFSAARSIAAAMADPGQRVWTLGMIAQAAAAAGQPADGLIAAARNTIGDIADAGQRAWALGALTQAAAATGQLAVGQAAAEELTEPAQRATAFGIIAQAATAAGQPADDLIVAACQAARTITHPGQRAWALGQLARDATVINRSELAAQLVSEAEEAALTEDPVLRAGLLAAMAQAADGQAGLAAMLFDRACRAADAPDLTQRVWALAEISRYAPGRTGWSAHLQDQARQVAGLADPVQRSAALAVLVQAANRSGDDVLARVITESIPSPGPQVSALVTLARSAAARGDYPGADALCDNAVQIATAAGPAAGPWAVAAISSARAFCGSLQAARAAEGIGRYDQLRALIGNEPIGVLGIDGSEEAFVAEVARGENMLDMIGFNASLISDPNRRGYLLAAAAKAQLADGNPEEAEETLSSMPPLVVPVDRAARGRLLAAATAVMAARDKKSACAKLTAGMAGFFSAELVSVIADLDSAAIQRLAQELDVP